VCHQYANRGPLASNDVVRSVTSDWLASKISTAVKKSADPSARTPRNGSEAIWLACASISSGRGVRSDFPRFTKTPVAWSQFSGPGILDSGPSACVDNPSCAIRLQKLACLGPLVVCALTHLTEDDLPPRDDCVSALVRTSASYPWRVHFSGK